MLRQGATTIWELWNGDTADIKMNSGNHVMLLGDLITWFYEYLGGIKTDGEAFDKVILKPYLPDGLNSVKVEYNSQHGMIRSDWRINDSDFNWAVSIPAGATAMVYIPCSNKNSITESGQTLKKSGVEFIKTEGNYAILKVGSGDYAFKSNR
jgi:alpha-L-rhamnosidase